MAYVGTPIDTANQFQSLQGKRFDGDGSTTAFTLDIAPSSVFDIEVFVENVRQDPNSAYTLSGTTLTFTGAPASGTNNIYVIHQAKAVGTIDLPEGALVDLNGGSAKLVLDADGDTTISADTDDQIDIKIGGSDIISATASALTVNSGVVFNENSASVDFRVESNGDANCLIVDGSGDKVGIGEDVPEGKLHVFTGDASVGPNAKADELVVESDGHAGISILSGASNDGNIYFGDSGDDDIGFITYAHGSDNLMQFGTNAAERMRISSSGEVLIGGTNSDYVDAGGIQTNGSGSLRTYGLYHNGTTSGIDLVNWNTGIGSGGLGSGGNFLQLTDGGNTRFKFKGDGNATCDASFSGGGADYAEYFEWKDGNSNNEDRIGLSVVLDNGKIREATTSDNNIIGVVSANPTVIGDEQPHHWQDKFVTDDYGRIKYEDLTCFKWEYINEKGEKETDSYIKGRTDKDIPENATNVESFKHSYEMINPNYDENLEYTPRSKRQEWSCIGLMGKLRIKKGQKTGTNWIKMRDISETVEEWLIK